MWSGGLPCSLASGSVYVRAGWSEGFPEVELFEISFESMSFLHIQAIVGGQWHVAGSEGSQRKSQQIYP